MKDIGQIVKTLKRRFHLEEYKERLADGRKRPQISAGTVGQAIIEMVPRKQQSLLAVDLAARDPETRAWFGSERAMVASDTTLFRSLASFNLEVVHEISWHLARSIGSSGRALRMELPSGRKARLGLLDGSVWGGFHGSVLTLAGRGLDVVAGYRMSPGRGHELTTSRGLLAEAHQQLGPGFVDLMVTDGEYMTKEDLEWCRGVGGFHLLVKTSEETLTVVQDARGLFFGNPSEFRRGLESAQGFDEQRGCGYKVTAAGDFEWQGVTVKVAHVWERYLKPKKGHPKETEFWVITTDGSLSAEDMREAAHLRWHIENKTFRLLNHLVESKQRVTKDEHTREALLGLWFIGLNLLGLVLACTRRSSLPEVYRRAKLTWGWFCDMYRRGVLLAAVQGLT